MTAYDEVDRSSAAIAMCPTLQSTYGTERHLCAVTSPHSENGDIERLFELGMADLTHFQQFRAGG